MASKPERKTKPGVVRPPSASVLTATQFLRAVPQEVRRDDALKLHRLFRKISGKSARMWGPSIVGYGSYRYSLANGTTGQAPRIAFSPRSANLVIYIMPGFAVAPQLPARLGKHKTGRSCLYITRLEQIDFEVLSQLVLASWEEMKRRYPE